MIAMDVQAVAQAVTELVLRLGILMGIGIWQYRSWKAGKSD